MQNHFNTYYHYNKFALRYGIYKSAATIEIHSNIASILKVVVLKYVVENMKFEIKTYLL